MSRSSTCPTPRYGSFIATSASCVRITHVDCKRWTCPHCGEINAFRLRLRMEGSTMKRLMTLTYKMSPGGTREQASTSIKAAWVHMRKRLARHLGEKRIHYILINEWTQAGAPHLHVLLDTPYLPQPVISAMWLACSGSYIVDIRAIRDLQGSIKYLTKYLVKDRWMPKKHRKFTSSKGDLPQLPPREYTDEEEEPQIQWSNHGGQELAQTLASIGCTVTQMPDGEYVAFVPQSANTEKIYGHLSAWLNSQQARRGS